VRCIVVLTHTCAYSLGYNSIGDEQRAFAESIARNPDIALVNLEGVDLSPYVDVLGVSGEIQNNRAILECVLAQRIAQQRVKSAKGGTR
jgi:hypothetical protein